MVFILNGEERKRSILTCSKHLSMVIVQTHASDCFTMNLQFSRFFVSKWVSYYLHRTRFTRLSYASHKTFATSEHKKLGYSYIHLVTPFKLTCLSISTDYQTFPPMNLINTVVVCSSENDILLQIFFVVFVLWYFKILLNGNSCLILNYARAVAPKWCISRCSWLIVRVLAFSSN